MRRSEQRKSAVFIAYTAKVTSKPVSQVLLDKGSQGEAIKPLTVELATGVARKGRELDDLIGSHAKGWTVERIAPLERSILQVALYEILFREDIPDEVSIDEAIEMTKRYCDKGAPAFVNGILGSILKEVKSARGK